MAAEPKRVLKAKKVGKGVCDFCGEAQPLSFTCRQCGFTLCQGCLQENPKKFLCASAIAWICPNCSNWETL